MTLGRPRNFDRDTALDAAMRLFWRKGFGDTSLDDLLEVMGLSKSSFYATFKSKEDLFSESLKHYSKSIAEAMGQRLLKAPSGRVFIEAIFSMAVQEAREKRIDGCLLLNSALEFGQRHPDFNQDIKKSMIILDGLFQQAVQRGQKEGDIASKTDAAILGTYLCSNFGGLRTLIKIGATPKKIEALIPSILKALE